MLWWCPQHVGIAGNLDPDVVCFREQQEGKRVFGLDSGTSDRKPRVLAFSLRERDGDLSSINIWVCCRFLHPPTLVDCLMDK